MKFVRVIMVSFASILAGCYLPQTAPQVSQCPVGAPPLQNKNGQVQFDDDGAMRQGQAFGKNQEMANLRAISAAENARQNARAHDSAYGYYSDCVSQGIFVQRAVPAVELKASQ